MTSTLSDAKAVFMDKLERLEGASCPCCDRYAQKYRKQPTSTSMACLIIFDRFVGGDISNFRHISELNRHNPLFGGLDGAWALLSKWGFIQEKPRVDKYIGPGGKTSGFWRLTAKGRQFVNREIKAPRYVLVFNSEILGWSREQWSADDFLKHKFSYAELMASGAP